MKPIKHEWIKYYLITSTVIGLFFYAVRWLKMSWTYHNNFDYIAFLLLVFFIVSYPIIAIIYALAKQKIGSITILLSITGVVWLFSAYILFLLFTLM